MPNSKPGLSYQWRIFSVLLAMCLLLVICFVGFQYFREKQYKADILNAELQIFNTQIMDRLEEGHDIQLWLDSIDTPLKDLRVTVYNTAGRVIFVNTLDALPRGTHLHRREIRQAMQEGSSYTMRAATSGTDGADDADIAGISPHEKRSQLYFYSVLAGKDFIVRTGAPYYSVSVGEVLKADGTFLWFMLIVSVLVCLIGYYSSRSIGQTITRLSKFAELAERGGKANDVVKFPRDELGQIASNIVLLYNRLLQTTEERDKQQLMLINEEEEKQRIKRDLTHNISHELKTPVASVLGCAETILEHPTLPDAKKMEFVERIASNARRLTSLLRDISTINRLDEASSVIDKEPMDLSALVQEVVDDARPRAAKAGMTVENLLPPHLYIGGNQGLLESVFRNLIENAIAYSGGTKVAVGLMEKSREQVTVTVSDNGSGIPEQHFPKIFDRFYRIDKGRSRKAGGTGLGLAIVRSAVVFHGGDITIQNLPEGGLEFAITLPCPDDPENIQETETEGTDAPLAG